jgi:hypothetical protein
VLRVIGAGCFWLRVLGLWFGFGNYGGACGNFWLYGNFFVYFLNSIIAVVFKEGWRGAGCAVCFFRFNIFFLELFPAIRSNLLCRTPAQKDFHFYRG